MAIAHAPAQHRPDPSHPPAAAADDARRSWLPLVVLCLAQFMVVLDITVVNVALPSIGAALQFAAADLQWVVTIYVLFTGGLLLLGGRAADLLGRRPMFLGGLLVFTTASLASGLATSSGMLVAARAGQGLGAALLTPAALALVTTTYTGAQRVTALSVWGAIGSAGAGAGVVLGGMLTTWLSWEWIFFINVPVGLVAAGAALRLIPATPLERSPGRGALDASGALTVVGGLVALIYGFTQAGQAGWGSTRALVVLAAGAALLAAFVAVERRARRPLLPPATWRTRSLASGAGVMLGVTGILVGTFFLNSLYLQGALGWSALRSGVAFLPLVVAIGAAVHVAAHLLPRLGSRVLAVSGLGLLAGGALLLAAAPGHAGYVADLLPGFVLVGLGTGLVFPSVSVAAMSEVDHASAGVASGFMTTAHELGAALGVAILSAVAAGAGTPAAGYGRAFLVAGALALVLGAVAAVAMPPVRPADGAHVPLH